MMSGGCSIALYPSLPLNTLEMTLARGGKVTQKSWKSLSCLCIIPLVASIWYHFESLGWFGSVSLTLTWMTDKARQWSGLGQVHFYESIHAFRNQNIDWSRGQGPSEAMAAEIQMKQIGKRPINSRITPIWAFQSFGWGWQTNHSSETTKNRKSGEKKLSLFDVNSFWKPLLMFSVYFRHILEQLSSISSKTNIPITQHITGCSFFDKNRGNEENSVMSAQQRIIYQFKWR